MTSAAAAMSTGAGRTFRFFNELALSSFAVSKDMRINAASVLPTICDLTATVGVTGSVARP
jgi:hypothetical protein